VKSHSWPWVEILFRDDVSLNTKSRPSKGITHYRLCSRFWKSSCQATCMAHCNIAVTTWQPLLYAGFFRYSFSKLLCISYNIPVIMLLQCSQIIFDILKRNFMVVLWKTSYTKMEKILLDSGEKLPSKRDKHFIYISLLFFIFKSSPPHSLGFMWLPELITLLWVFLHLIKNKWILHWCIEI